MNILLFSCYQCVIKRPQFDRLPLASAPTQLFTLTSTDHLWQVIGKVWKGIVIQSCGLEGGDFSQNCVMSTASCNSCIWAQPLWADELSRMKYTCAVKQYYMLDVKNTLVKSFILCHREHHLQCCVLTEEYHRDVAARLELKVSYVRFCWSICWCPVIESVLMTVMSSLRWGHKWGKWR